LQSKASARIRLVGSARDFRAFRDLVVEYENALPAELRHAALQRELENLRRNYGPPNALFVATVADAPAGCVALIPLDASTGVIQRLYVKPSYRKLGVARALLAGLIDVARRRGHSRVVLDTDRERLRAAYTLYLALGFERCDPYGEVEYASPTFMQLRLL
jgi:GNAT superfamily N-acetyltransferase